MFVDEPDAQEWPRAPMDIVQLHGSESPDHIPARDCACGRRFVSRPTGTRAVMSLICVSRLSFGRTRRPEAAKSSIGAAPRAAAISSSLAGLGPDNVAEAIRQARPWGVDACSRLERAPGLKDHEKMRRFVRAALESI